MKIFPLSQEHSYILTQGDKMDNPLFMHLILGLQQSAWMMLGKLQNPMTGKVEKNLEQAKVTIDTLQMLKDKSKGNLTENEERAINQMLADLHLNYVEEAKVPVEEEKKKVEEKETKEEETKEAIGDDKGNKEEESKEELKETGSTEKEDAEEVTDEAKKDEERSKRN